MATCYSCNNHPACSQLLDFLHVITGKGSLDALPPPPPISSAATTISTSLPAGARPQSRQNSFGGGIEPNGAGAGSDSDRNDASVSSVRSAERSYGDKRGEHTARALRPHGGLLPNQVETSLSKQRGGEGNGSSGGDENKENGDVHMKGNKVASVHAYRVLPSAPKKHNDALVSNGAPPFYCASVAFGCLGSVASMQVNA